MQFNIKNGWNLLFSAHTQVILKRQKINNLNANFAFINNVNFRREVPNWNGSSFCAFLKGLCPFAIPTKGSALSKPALRSAGQIFAMLLALILFLYRALITRICWNVKFYVYVAVATGNRMQYKLQIRVGLGAHKMRPYTTEYVENYNFL